MAEKLILNTLTFDYPTEPVKFYFSSEDDAQHKSSILKSPVLVPAEVIEPSDLMKANSISFMWWDKIIDDTATKNISLMGFTKAYQHNK